MADFIIKRNDTVPTLQLVCERPAGTPKDLTGASARFHLKNSAGTVIVDQPAAITDAVNGVVEYAWAPTDTATAGYFQFEVEVTYSGGEIETFPQEGNLVLKVYEDIA